MCSFCVATDGSLMSKDSLPTQSTTLEALLRGEGLDKRNNSKNDEESLLEIQVSSAHIFTIHARCIFRIKHIKSFILSGVERVPEYPPRILLIVELLKLRF